MSKAARLEQQILDKITLPLTPYAVLKAAREVLIPLVNDDPVAVEQLTLGHCRSWKDLQERAKSLWTEDNPSPGDALIGAEFSCRARSKKAREEARTKQTTNWWDNVTICRLCWRPAPSGKVKPTCYLHSLTNKPPAKDRQKYQKAMRAYDEYKKQLAQVQQKKRAFGFRLVEGQVDQDLNYIANIFPLTVSEFAASDWPSLLDGLLGIKDFDSRGEASPSPAEKEAILKVKKRIIAKPNEETGWLVQAEAWLRAFEARPRRDRIKAGK